MNSEQFLEYLEIYGSEIGDWPPDIRAGAVELLNGSVQLAQAVQDQKNFESLLNERQFEEPSSDLERRISLLAKNKEETTKAGSTWFKFSELFYIPKPVFALVFILLFGFMLGFFYDSYANGVDDVELGDMMYYEDDGGFYEQEG